jgi:fumarate reductase flavoprotein subunit
VLKTTGPDSEIVAHSIEQCLLPFKQTAGDVNAIRDDLLDVMWDGVGVLRDAQGIAKAQSDLAQLKTELESTGIGDDNRVFNLSWHDWLNLRSLIEVSEVIAAASLARENSRGAHFREDFPDVGSLEESYFTIASRNHDGVRVERAPVEFAIVKPGESLIEND